MALIKCPECDRDISETAGSCPVCGYPLKNKVRKNLVKIHMKESVQFVRKYLKKFSESMTFMWLCTIVFLFIGGVAIVFGFAFIHWLLEKSSEFNGVAPLVIVGIMAIASAFYFFRGNQHISKWIRYPVYIIGTLSIIGWFIMIVQLF